MNEYPTGSCDFLHYVLITEDDGDDEGAASHNKASFNRKPLSFCLQLN